MDRSASPWRVLDDTAGAVPSGAQPGNGAAPPTEPVSPPIVRTLQIVGGLAIAAVLAAVAFVVAASGSSGSGVTVDSSTVAIDASERPARASDAVQGGDVVVDVQGAVVQPGIHRLAAGSRIADAIASAGGYGPRVDTDRAGREINLAAQLHDGDRVLVPSRDDPPGSVAGGSPASAGAGSGTAGPGRLVDLNHASASELDTLPGIGPVTAQKIIAAREEQPFATIEALRDRKVVGGAAFDKLKDLVTVTP
jgi:competence protein ComEA